MKSVRSPADHWLFLFVLRGPRCFAVEPFCKMGRADGSRFCAGHPPVAGRLRASLRHRRKARTASAARHRLARRALRRDERGQAGVRRRLSRILLRPDLRSAPAARHRSPTASLRNSRCCRRPSSEMARNGCKKVVIVNGHGGNESLLPLFGAVAACQASATTWSTSSACRTRMSPAVRRSRRRTTCTPAKSKHRTC